MKKQSILHVILLSAIAFSFFPGCKKGADDPFLSFRSRKSRVAGEWKVTSYVNTQTDPTGTSTYTSNGSTYTYTDPTGTATGTETQELTMDKKGTYKLTIVRDGITYTSSGTWNFTDGVGDLKKRSQVTLYEQSNTDPSGTNTFTGNYVDVAFDLTDLHSKKMVWYSKITSTTSSITSSSEETYTWEAK